MKVELLRSTPDALDLLLETKNTRLKYEDDPSTWSEEKKAEHLRYMLGTVKSSWEFVRYVFRITGVTRAFTHQLVRTRTQSYAQESMRTVDVREADVMMPDFHQSAKFPLSTELVWKNTVDQVKTAYGAMVDDGVPPGDARGILPTNTTTGIIVGSDLRTLHETAKVRLCTRTQGEYQRVFREMRRLVIEEHPWAEPFIQVHCVAMGTCAFPHYGPDKCPFYDSRMDLEGLKAETKERFWSGEIVEANPVAKEGMAK